MTLRERKHQVVDRSDGRATHLRHTLLASSRETLRRLGHFERYEALLGGDARSSLREIAMTPGWASIDHGVAHYAACDALGRTQEQLLEVGRAVGARIRGTALGTLARLAARGGVGPWTPLGQLDKLVARMCRGGSVRVFREGPKNALVELGDNPIWGFDFCAYGMGGILEAVSITFTRRVDWEVSPPTLRGDGRRYALAWV